MLLTMMRFLIICLCAAIFGCANAGIYQSSTQVAEHGITAVSYPENHRIAFVKRNKDVEHLCSGSGMDVASTTISGLSLGAPSVDSKAKIGESRERAETGLGGRDPAVLIIREILFRTCETIMNNELGPEDALELYRQTLQTVKVIAQVHGGQGTEAGKVPMAGEESDDDDGGDDY